MPSDHIHFIFASDIFRRIGIHYNMVVQMSRIHVDGNDALVAGEGCFGIFDPDLMDEAGGRTG